MWSRCGTAHGLLQRGAGIGQALAADLLGLLVEPPVVGSVVDEAELLGGHGTIMNGGCDSYVWAGPWRGSTGRRPGTPPPFSAPKRPSTPPRGRGPPLHGR